jgi:predicted hotdog family 3-hydroxylacyl-ACP dehydratase
MKNEKYLDLAEVLPHRQPMILIDRICSYDVEGRTLTAEFDVKDGSMFFDAVLCGTPSWVGLEYMAQTVGALTGILGLEERGEKPQIGFILGTRKYLNNICHFSVGKTYTVEASVVFYDDSVGSFKCEIRESTGEICAMAEINAFSPENVELFLKDAMNG